MRSDIRQWTLNVKCLHLPKLLGQHPPVEVYIALRDPHSYMLIQALQKIEKRYRIHFKLYLVYESVPGVTIFPELMQRWALTDANVIAKRFGLDVVDKYPSEQSLLTGQQMWQLTVKSIDEAAKLFEKTWQESFECTYITSTPVINFQVKNQQRLINKGHYLSATVFFAGDWFMGVDRLYYLERRLNALDLNKTEIEHQFDQCQQTENVPDIDENHECDQPIEIYLSLRSPYSYLGFVKAQRLAKKYNLPLTIKPIMPLMMRGLKVPLSKQRYIYTDAHRIAKSANIPFESFTDPLGGGIVNCYQVFAYAQQQNKDVEYIAAAFNAIYVDNIDVESEAAMKQLCQSIGLDYDEALAYQQLHDWQVWSDKHLAELSSVGLWGAPCFKYKETYCWGQDRLFLIEQAITEEKSLQTELEEPKQVS